MKARLLMGIIAVLSFTLGGVTLVLHGFAISNIAESVIGAMVLMLGWFIFTDKEYKDNSLKDIIFKKK